MPSEFFEQWDKPLHYKTLDQMYFPLDEDGDVPEFVWASANRLLTPWIPDRFSFAFNDPPSFSDIPVNPDVFVKLLNNLRDPDGLKEESMIKLVNAFSSKCTKPEWTDFYQPVLQQRQDHGISLGSFNFRIEGDNQFRLDYYINPFGIQDVITSDPMGDGHFYPYCEMFGANSWYPTFVYVTRDDVELLDWEFKSKFLSEECVNPFEHLNNSDSIKYPLFFEGISDGHELILLDVFQLQDINVWPGAFRRQLLEDTYMMIMEREGDNKMLVLGEGMPGNENDIERMIKEFKLMGNDWLPMLLFKPGDTPYTEPAFLVPTNSLEEG